MEIFNIMFLSCISILFGMILMIFLQYCILLKYFRQSQVSSGQKRIISEAYCLPEALKKHLDSEDYNNEESKHCSVPISLLLQFLFHELRHSDTVKRWLYRKLSLEFDELLTKTTTGKFFEAVSIRDMNLGSQFPDIKNLTVENVILGKGHGHIDVLNLCVQLDYSGNFLLSVDAKMKFGKTAYLSITVKRISGLARLQFTRIPYTHWSFSFYSDPLVELGVESQFQGRQLQSNITSLIINQIKKAIKRKHTLPNYKIRYKPFFNKTDPCQLDIDDCELVPQGVLEITCIEVTRLAVTFDVANIVYCTFTIDSIPWVRLTQSQQTTYIIMDLTVMKNRQQQLGVVFKQEPFECKGNNTSCTVSVETVVPQSPAWDAGLCSGDCLISIDSKSISSMTQIAKIIRSVTAASFCVRIKRIVKNYTFTSKQSSLNTKTEIKTNIPKSDSADELDNIQEYEKIDKKTNDKSVENLDANKKPKSIVNIESKFKSGDKLPKLLSTSNENVSKLAQTIGSFSLRKRKPSVERVSNDNIKNSQSVSTPNTPQHSKHTLSSQGIFSKTKTLDKTITEDVISNANALRIEHTPEITHETIECYETPNLGLDPMIIFNDDHSFSLKDSDKYLNINVWGRNKLNEDILLGYTNIPLVHILNECCNSMLGHYVNSYSFLPPDNLPPNSQTHPLLSHSGFEHCFCYGDILLSFVWISEDISNIKRKLSTNMESIIKEDSLKSQYSKHDFIRTQFHRTTHCDFCSKKIWLKDAVQCRNCALCCHKKCVLKCQTSTTCTPLENNSVKNDNPEFSQPEITMTEVCSDQISELSDSELSKPYCTENSSQNYNGNGMKRVNSVNSLTVPGTYAFQNSQTRSLPPSPQHTPGRKQSLVNINPFALCPALLESCYVKPTDPVTTDSISQIIEQLLQCNQNENLMDMAKETGIQFYSSIPHEQRTDKINTLVRVICTGFYQESGIIQYTLLLLHFTYSFITVPVLLFLIVIKNYQKVTELKKTLDAMTLEHMELSKQMNVEENPTEKTKLAFLVGQADAKVHALSVLMLHYCSGLQQVQEKIV